MTNYMEVIHKARPASDPAYCAVCGQEVKRVLGGQGPVWVHAATGAVAGRGGDVPADGEAEREVRVTVHAPDHLSLTEIAEMFWDKLDRPNSVFTVCAIAVSTAPSCTPYEGPLVTKAGRVLTDADIDQLAEEAERGYELEGEQRDIVDPEGRGRADGRPAQEGPTVGTVVPRAVPDDSEPDVPDGAH